MLIFSGVKTLNKNRYLLEPPTSTVLIHHTALPPQHPLTPHNGEYCNFNYFTKTDVKHSMRSLEMCCILSITFNIHNQKF